MDIRDLSSIIAERRFPIPWPGHYIRGSWHRVSRVQQLVKSSLNPNDGTLLCEAVADRESVQIAIDSAYKIRRDVFDITFEQRLLLLEKLAALLAEHEQTVKWALRLEAGKPKWEANEEFEQALKYLRWVAKDGEQIREALIAPAKLTRKEGEFMLLPIGVAAAYVPFSDPLSNFIMSLSSAFLAGCPMVFCSSSHAIVSSLVFATLVQELDLPAGAVSFLFGNFNSFRQALSDPRIGVVIYTGSREHCEAIRGEAKVNLARQVILQSGGKNAVIVDESASLDQALRCILYGAFKTAGQRCTSTSRVFVHEDLAGPLTDKLTHACQNLNIGRTDVEVANDDDAAFMGPLYSKKAVEKHLRFQTMANRESSKTMMWGKSVESFQDGYFVTPGLHLISKFDNHSAYQGNVLFSPDLAFYKFQDLGTAIDQINTTDAAFAVSYIGEVQQLRDVRMNFLAPNLLVNMPTTEIETTLPLAGRLQSGHHRFHGPGIALYFCYPQVVEHSSDNAELLKAWPWPAY